MNIYLIHEDGEKFCIKASSMSEATKISEDAYIAEILLEGGILDRNGEERQYYRDQILESCHLVGELKNPD